MTPPDSMGKVVELLEEARVEFAGHPSSGIMRRVITRLQALDRQRQEEVAQVREAYQNRTRDYYAQGDAYDAMRARAEAAEAALREAGRDAERLDWLDANGEAYGFESTHEGNRWLIEGAYPNLRAAIDAALNGGQDDA